MKFSKQPQIKLTKLLIVSKNFFLIILILNLNLGCSKSPKITEAYLYANLRTQNENNKNDYALHYLSSIDINDPWWNFSKESQRIADNLLSWQLANGAWAKGVDKINLRFENSAKQLTGTFDNFATTNEIEFLLKLYSHTKNESYLKSIKKGVDLILDAQYDSGAWPQNYPLTGDYSDYATFNDDVIVNILNLLLIIQKNNSEQLLDQSTYSRINLAIKKGLNFIVKSQIINKDNIKLGWAQQYDPLTYEPKAARSFEPIALSSRETVSIIELLLKINKPSSEISTAIKSAKDWLKKSAIVDYEWSQSKGALINNKGSKIWSRFYDINTNSPIFCGRDGILKSNVHELEEERRKGYEWYGTWALNLE